MNATKEACDRVLEIVRYRGFPDLATTPMESAKLVNDLEYVLEFLAKVWNKLPGESAYEKERVRKREYAQQRAKGS